jgi:phosphate transport system substrate-binding protein
MNNNESYNKGTVVCLHCRYDANPVGVKHCEKCGKELTIASIPTNKDIGKVDTAAWGFLLLIALSFLTFGAFGYYYGLQMRLPIFSSNEKRSSNDGYSDIEVYDSMKDVPNVPQGTFNYAGAISFAPLVSHGTYKAINKAHPNFHLRYTPGTQNNPGTWTAMSMLFDGELSFVQAGGPINDQAYSKAKERGFSLQQVPIAIDGILLYTHSDLSIPGLSLGQIRDIFKGKIVNWKQVGGPDLAITAFAINPKFGTALSFLLGSELSSLSPKVNFMKDYTNGIRQVASTPGAIGIGQTAAIVGQRSIRPVAIKNGNSYIQPFINDGTQINAAAFKDGTYPLTKRLFIVIRRDGTSDEAAGVAYTNLLLSKEGQQFIEKSGFVSIH